MSAASSTRPIPTASRPSRRWTRDTGDIVTVGNGNSTDVDQYWDYRAELTQTLFRWDQWQELKRADSQVAVAEATYRAAQQDLLVRVSQAYFDVLAAEDTLGAAQATLEAFSRQLEQAEKRFEVGLIAITDVQESRAAHDSATAGVIAAKRALATSQEVLRELTDKNYTVAGEAGGTDAAQQAGPAGRAGVGRPCAGEQPQRGRGAPEFGSRERQRQGRAERPPADGRSVRAVRRERPRRHTDQPVVRPL